MQNFFPNDFVGNDCRVGLRQMTASQDVLVRTCEGMLQAADGGCTCGDSKPVVWLYNGGDGFAVKSQSLF